MVENTPSGVATYARAATAGSAVMDVTRLVVRPELAHNHVRPPSVERKSPASKVAARITPLPRIWTSATCGLARPALAFVQEPPALTNTPIPTVAAKTLWSLATVRDDTEVWSSGPPGNAVQLAPSFELV